MDDDKATQSTGSHGIVAYTSRRRMSADQMLPTTPSRRLSVPRVSPALLDLQKYLREIHDARFGASESNVLLETQHEAAAHQSLLHSRLSTYSAADEDDEDGAEKDDSDENEDVYALLQLFDRLDTAGSGFVSGAELRSALEQHDYSENLVDYLWQQMNTLDQSHPVARLRFARALRTAPRRLLRRCSAPYNHELLRCFDDLDTPSPSTNSAAVTD